MESPTNPDKQPALLWRQANRRDYHRLDRAKQSEIVGNYIDQNGERANELAGYWNDFAAEHPDILELKTFSPRAVGAWAKKKGVTTMPDFDRLALHRDLADTLAADKARAAGAWTSEKVSKEPAPPPAADGAEPKKRRKKRELTPEQKEDAALAAEWGFSYKYDKAPVAGERLPLSGAPKPPSYDVQLPELYNRRHWHTNHAKSDAYKEQKKQALAEQLTREGYLRAPQPGDQDFVPESRAEFAAHTAALLSSTQPAAGQESERGTMAAMEKPPRATPAPTETGELSSQETAERILDYYDHRDETAAPAESAPLSSQETAERILEHYDNPVADAPTEPAPAEQELDLTKVADANVAFEEQDEPNATTPAEEDPFAQPDTTPKSEGMEDFTWDQYLKERSVALDKSAESMGEKEGSWIRNLGERYNKLNWKWKLVACAALGGAAAAGMAFGSPVALMAGAFGTAGQRVLGGLGMFVKAEDYLQNKAAANEKDEAVWKRQLKAAGAALAYTGLATFGIKKAIDYTADWLGHMWPADVPEGIHGQPVSEIADKLPTAPEAPGITVEATKGKGYEFMAKRLWEQLHAPESGVDQDFFANNPGSDAARLWNAKPEEIDALVHKLATEHGFYQADADNVLVKPDSVLGFTPDGEIRLGAPGGSEVINASAEAPVTPPYNPEAPAPASTGAVPTHEYADPSVQHTPEGDAYHAGDVAPHESTAADHSFINSNGVEVIDSRANLYTSPSGKELFVYGGSPQEQSTLVGEFFANPQNADKVIYGADNAGTTRVGWHLQNGEITPAPVAKQRFLGFGRGFEKAPSPNDLGMLIKVR